MPENNLTYRCGDTALEEAITFCQANNFNRFTLVNDTNTYAVLGKRVEELFRAQKWAVHTIILEGEEIIADAATLNEALAQSGSDPGVYLAVGSGTITDITRYCSHQQGSVFISLPTAPSVDGFASSVAPVVIRGNKESLPCQAPIAIFADLPTLCQAPAKMIAAGFGDMIGKYTALADWKLAHLIMDDPYDAAIAARMESALKVCVDHREGIRQTSPEGIAGLMNGLVESGICMALAGNSRPASGSEHHLSHYWEMMLLHQGRPALLHGAKVGIGAVLIAERWQLIRALTIGEVKGRLKDARLPLPQKEREVIETAFPSNPNTIVQNQSIYLSMTNKEFQELKKKIIHKWKKIIEIAATVPPAHQIVALLQTVNAPVTAAEIGLKPKEEMDALRYSHYLRSQFTVLKLSRFLGLL